MTERWTEKEIEALRCLYECLGAIGGSNDAGDHGYAESARAMRENACATIRKLMSEQPLIGNLFPDLEHLIDSGKIDVVHWLIYQRQIADFLAPA